MTASKYDPAIKGWVAATPLATLTLPVYSPTW
jgi:hypothetical protein